MQPIQHDFIALDEGRAALLHINERDPSKNWSMPICQPHSRDMQLIEFNPKGEIVWSWSQADMISSLQGVLVLDDLDTARLHDERRGILEPILA